MCFGGNRRDNHAEEATATKELVANECSLLIAHDLFRWPEGAEPNIAESVPHSQAVAVFQKNGHVIKGGIVDNAEKHKRSA